MFIFHVCSGQGVSVPWINNSSSIYSTIHDSIRSIRNLVMEMKATIIMVSITDKVSMYAAIDTTCAW